jgi:hypothetical protein
VPAEDGAVNVPLKAPLPPVVDAVAAMVQGPLGEALYCRVTVAPLGTLVVAVTTPEKATLVVPACNGVEIALSVVVVG